MPFIVRNKKSTQVLTAMLTNHYDLEYYGAVYGNTKEEAEAQLASWSQQEGRNESDWIVEEVEETILKLCNVKLRNDPSLALFMDENGRLRTDHHPSADV